MPSHIPLLEIRFNFCPFFSENTITGIIESTFSVENNSFGAIVVHELKPGGASIAVTEENKREYVKLYVNYRFMRGIEQQFLALQKGKPPLDANHSFISKLNIRNAHLHIFRFL